MGFWVKVVKTKKNGNPNIPTTQKGWQSQLATTIHKRGDNPNLSQHQHKRTNNLDRPQLQHTTQQRLIECLMHLDTTNEQISN